MNDHKTTETNNFEIDSWAIVEVFGHAKLAGKVRSGLIGPNALLQGVKTNHERTL